MGARVYMHSYHLFYLFLAFCSLHLDHKSCALVTEEKGWSKSQDLKQDCVLKKLTSQLFSEFPSSLVLAGKASPVEKW